MFREQLRVLGRFNRLALGKQEEHTIELREMNHGLVGLILHIYNEPSSGSLRVNFRRQCNTFMRFTVYLN
jgi:hypothetical protein